MSKTALALLVLLALSAAVLAFLPLPSPLLSTMAKALFVLLLGASVVALVLGRRFKFDPVMRSSIR